MKSREIVDKYILVRKKHSRVNFEWKLNCPILFYVAASSDTPLLVGWKKSNFLVPSSLFSIGDAFPRSSLSSSGLFSHHLFSLFNCLTI